MQTEAVTAAPVNNSFSGKLYIERIIELLSRHTMENDGKVLEGVFDSAEKRRKSE